MKRQAKESRPDIVRTTLRVPKTLWTEVQHRAIDEGLTLQGLINRALAMYLKTKAGKP